MHTPDKLEINPEHKDCVVDGVDKFVSDINLSKYVHLKPNDGRVILKEFKDKPGENKSESGLIIGTETEDAQEVSVVVAVGKGMYNGYLGVHAEMPYKVGDVVFAPEHFGHNFIFGGDREVLLSIAASDIIAKL